MMNLVPEKHKLQHSTLINLSNYFDNRLAWFSISFPSPELGPSRLIAITGALEKMSNTAGFVLRRLLISPQYCHLVINEALLLLQPHGEPGWIFCSNPYSDVERIIVQNSHSIMSHQHQLILSSGRKVRARWLVYYYSQILVSINNPRALINTFIN